jgi:hypothetical protein
MTKQLSFTRFCTDKKDFKGLIDYLLLCTSLAEDVPALLIPLKKTLRRTIKENIEFQHQQPMLNRNKDFDRVFPLDTVEIHSFRTKYDADLKNPIIHYGPNSDEFARSYNALAVTIGRDIYFRNGAYQPENEEGRKTLGHELTHVQQYEQQRITPASDEKILESEAQQIELSEEYNSDKLITVSIDNDFFTFRESEMDEITDEIASDVDQWVKEQEHILSEEAYLVLLCRYQNLLEGGTF